MGRASNQKWIHRAERVVNMTRRRLIPAESMFAWRRSHKFWRAMLFVLARPYVVKARGISPLKTLQSFFTSRGGLRAAV